MNDQPVPNFDQILDEEEGVKGSQPVQLPEKSYNRAVEGTYHGVHGTFVDVIDGFPPDIWIPIIQESLPVQDYSSSLLLLTTVSTKWQRAITSTPLLWAHIEISGVGEDTLALIHTFTCLSRNSPLLLTLYVPFYYEPEILESVLSTFSGRLHRVVFRIDNHPSSRRNNLSDAALIQAVMALLHHRRHLSNVTQLEIEQYSIDQVVHAGRTQLTDFLPPQLKVIRGFCFCRETPQISRGELRRLEEVSSCVQTETLIPSLGHLPKLKSLTMPHNAKTFIERPPTPMAITTLSNLTKLSFQQKYQSIPIGLIDTVAPQLLDLELQASYIEVPDIAERLTMATRLNTLSLTVSDRKGMTQIRDRPSVIRPRKSIPSLRALSISFETDSIRGQVEFTQSIQLQLIEVISLLYQNVADVVFYLSSVDNLISPILRYLSELGSLEHLKLDGLGWDIISNERQEVTLQSLKVLELCTPVLVGYIRAPQLQTLTLPWDDDCEEDGILNYPTLRALHVKGGDDCSRRIDVPTDVIPSLTKLTLHVSGCDSIQLGLALFLTEITIIGEPDTSIATSLCFTILYQPEECPSLYNIKLLGCAPEWDVLLTMLESRNFMANCSVSRIRRVTLPSVPYRLRGPIASLLRGLYTTRPQNDDLSIKGITEMFFDREIPGCRTCLKGMLSPCNDLTTSTGDTSEVEDLAYSVYSTVYDPPPPDLDPKILNWIYWRERDIESWVAAVFTMGSSCWRTLICATQECNVPVEITEHDAF